MRFYKGNTRNTEESVLGGLTGRNNAVQIRNAYQKRIDDKLAETWNLVHYLEIDEKNLRTALENLQASEALVNTLVNDHGEKLGTLSEHHNNVSKQEAEGFRQITDVLKEQARHPTKVYARSPVFGNGPIVNTPGIKFPKRYENGAFKKQQNTHSNDIRHIKDSERIEKQKYMGRVKYYAQLVNQYSLKLAKVEANLKQYEFDLETGRDILNKERYVGSFFYNISGFKNQSEVTLNTLTHDTEKLKVVIETLKAKFAEYPPAPKIDALSGYSTFM